jgi:hypothetical protein
LWNAYSANSQAVVVVAVAVLVIRIGYGNGFIASVSAVSLPHYQFPCLFGHGYGKSYCFGYDNDDFGNIRFTRFTVAQRENASVILSRLEVFSFSGSSDRSPPFQTAYTTCHGLNHQE